MSACVSSLIPSAIGQPGRLPALAQMPPQGLLIALGAVAHTYKRRGVRHGFVSILALGACAVLAGARSFTSIAGRAHDLTPAVRVKLGTGRVPPSETTIRRARQTLDPGVLDQDIGAVLGQCSVDAKTNEINAFAPLLDRLNTTDAIITAASLHTQRAHVSYLSGRGAQYIFTGKGNHPGLHRQLRSLPWKDIPPAGTTHGRDHGRVETRTIKLAAVPAGIAFPQAALAIQITHAHRPFGRKRASRVTVYAIIDLAYDAITPAQPADAIRGHWSIENRLHWIRDATFAEDHSQIRTGHGPQPRAPLRNLAVSLHRLGGATNIAAACRRISRHPDRVPSLIR